VCQLEVFFAWKVVGNGGTCVDGRGEGSYHPNLNSFAERWVRSAKDECLSKLILFGEASLHRVLPQFQALFHQERPHQGKGNVILFPAPGKIPSKGPVACRERLGGLLKYYHREAG
jgi:hypothetical protein